MKFPRITIVLLLCVLLASGLACSVLPGGGETDPTPTPPPSTSIPSAPTLIKPNNGAKVDGTSITFQWNASPGAAGYWLRVSNSAYPNLDEETSFVSEGVGNVKRYTVSGFPDDGTEYVWGVWSGNAAGWSPKPGVLANARIFSNGFKYMQSGNQTYFLLTAYAKEPVHLEISNPDGSLLDRVYVPPVVETPEITENVVLPPTPSGGTYGLRMYSDVTGNLVWQGEQTFAGPKLEILGLSLNPHWTVGIGWDLQYLTMTLKNTGDMPIILYGLKLRLEAGGFTTQEITLARQGDIETVYGWTRKGGSIWGLVQGSSATIAPWGSNSQHLFGQYFDPDEYQISVTLSEQLNILPVPELAFETPP